ncbi:hypothetical protein NLG97_g2650 [Lecanicillium saksenae]|uniref:Uncharacterized protein n=1 Tax=Lecanicillium saksenae TaxID=468837 RepID=A0ACC1R4D2_9HYPO|nr:hypothetical protein NLG97_g2650 [Lecanicillium saksenae]
MADTNPLPDIPAIHLTFPSTPVLTEAVAFIREHASENTVNHSIRTAYWALILSKKHPSFAKKALDIESVLYATLMHDIGWGKTKSQDTRFEVDGANIARDFLANYKKTYADRKPAKGTSVWDQKRVQLTWDSIALHTTPSIGLHKEPEVALTAIGISAEFYGPRFPGKLISVDEYNAVASLFPKIGFADELIQIMCGLCREKANTTFDNVVGTWGLLYGLDGKGGNVDVYRSAWEKANDRNQMVQALRYLEAKDAARKGPSSAGSPSL